MFKNIYGKKSIIEIDNISEIEKRIGRSLVKLSRNENVFGPSPKAQIKLEELTLEDLMYYPDLEYQKLDNVLSSKNNVEPNNLYVSSGSDDFIYYLCRSILEKDDEVVMYDLTFRSYNDAIKKSESKIVEVKRNEDFSYSTDDILSKISNKTKMVVLVNPNMPTGIVTQKSELKKLLNSIPENVAVIVDMAYAEYVEDDSYEQDPSKIIEGRNNVFVLKTLSKFYGLAGLRVGYVISSKENIQLLKGNIRRLTISRPSQRIAATTVSDKDYYDNIKLVNIENRIWFENELSRLKLPFVKSSANFVLLTIADKKLQERLFEAILMDNGILIRKYDSSSFLRITIGKKDQMKEIIKSMERVIND